MSDQKIVLSIIQTSGEYTALHSDNPFKNAIDSLLDNKTIKIKTMRRAYTTFVRRYK